MKEKISNILYLIWFILMVIWLRYSIRGLAELCPKGGQKEGFLIRAARDGNLVVRWNDQNTPHTYHPDFIEII